MDFETWWENYTFNFTEEWVKKNEAPKETAKNAWNAALSSAPAVAGDPCGLSLAEEIARNLYPRTHVESVEELTLKIRSVLARRGIADK